MDTDPPGDETLPPGGSAVRSSPRRVCPTHYRLVRLLGAGRMGEVYEAYDLRLQRPVAIKFLKDTDADWVARFMREGHTLARLTHEHLCKIYEMGEVDQQPYIVMQLIRGGSLHDHRAHLSLRRKLEIIAAVAQALHHAHRRGIVHRDLKPSNILLGAPEDGDDRPYVMDFGIARWAAEQPLTLTGEVLGTPGYMAPEQARGELERQNQMTDVYGLGATLYYLLAGRAPFEGEGHAAVLMDLLSREATPLTDIDSRIPREVAVITAKCLAKNQAERYGSALELAQDLDRYLAGRPILARPPTLRDRLAKWVARHRLPAALGTAALILPLLALSWGAWRSARREDLTRRLTAQVKEVEALTRFSHLSRRHDIRADRARLEGRLAAIAGEVTRGGRIARGPGNFALGWGYQVAGRAVEARPYLERAWAAGFRDPALIRALSLCYSSLYRARFAEALLADGALRTELEAQAAALRDQALAHLVLLPPDDRISPHYLQALVAYCDLNYDETLRLLDRVPADMAWFYEVHKLRGDTYRAQAVTALRAGDRTSAGARFRDALDAFAQVRHIAQSDPEGYKAAAKTLLGMMTLDMFADDDLAAYAAEALAILADCRTVLPDDPEVPLLEGRIHCRRAQRAALHREDAEAHLEAGVRALQEAAAAGADAQQVHLYLGALYRQRAEAQSNRREDPTESARLAEQALGRVTAAAYGYQAGFYLGSSRQILARYQAGHGTDPMPAYRAAATAYRQAAALAPDRTEVRTSLAQCLYHMAQEDAGHAATYLAEARDLLTDVLRAVPEQWAVRYQLGRVLLLDAEGGMPGSGMLDVARCAEAQTQFEAGLASNDQYPHLYEKLSWAWLLRAQWAWQQGEDPEPHFARAEAVCRTGAERVAQPEALWRHLATVDYFRGKFLVRAGRDADAAFDRAQAGAERVLALRKRPDTYLILASIARLRAEAAFARGADPDPFLETAEAHLRLILKTLPRHAEGHRSLGRLLTLRARVLAARGGEAGPVFAAAREALDRADAGLWPFLSARVLLVLRRHAWDGAWAEDPKALLRALDAAPPLPEARVARAALARLCNPDQAADGPGAEAPFVAAGRDRLYR